MEIGELRQELAFASTSLAHLGSAYAALAGLAARFMPRVGAFEQVSRGRTITTGAAHTASAQRLTAADQWSKLSNILQTSVGRATAAEQNQLSATRQLDLAQYALTTLVDELSAVMTLPGRRSRTATLHMFGSGQDAFVEVAKQTGSSHALAA